MENLKRSWKKSRKIMEFVEQKRTNPEEVKNALDTAVTKLLSVPLFRYLHPKLSCVLFLVPFHEETKLAS